MTTHSIYRLSDGVFTGQRVGGDESFVAAHTPEDCGALLGEHDHLRVRLDVASGQLVLYKPPAPADHQFCTWRWDEEAWQWVGEATDDAVAFEAREERARRLAACDWVVARAMEQGEPVPADWQAYRKALREISQQPGFPRAIQWPEPPG